MIHCEICNKKYTKLGLALHIKRAHKMSSEVYCLRFVSGTKNRCVTCGKETSFISLWSGFCRFCSTKCSTNAIETKNKIKNTRVEKYGGHHLANKKILAKVRQKNLKKYGKAFLFETEEFKANLKANRNTPAGKQKMKEALKKARQTYKLKTGYDHPSQNPEIKERKRQKSLAKYGTTCTLHGEKIKQKVTATMLSKFGVEHSLASPKVRAKSKKTLIKKYGVDHISKSKQHRAKVKETNLTRYGVEYCIFTERARANSLKALRTFPNKFETACRNYLNTQFGKGTFKYVGDGSMLVEKRSPDFYSKKLNTIVLCHGNYWHLIKDGYSNIRSDKEKVEEKDAEVFLKHGYKVIFIWEDELERKFYGKNSLTKAV